MEEFITEVSVLKDALATTGEKLKESKIILIMLGALGEEYESFVSSIMTRYVHDMMFTTLCELLMDQEMRLQKTRFLRPTSINVETKSVSSPKTGDSSPTRKLDV